MKTETKFMAFVLFIVGILGLVSAYESYNWIDAILGDYATIFNTYTTLGILAFLITTIMFILVVFAEHKLGYGMLITLLLFGILAIPIGAIISVIFILWIIAEYKKFDALL